MPLENISCNTTIVSAMKILYTLIRKQRNIGGNRMTPTKNDEKRKLLWAIISAGILIVVLSLSLSWLGLPWMANHFGFALPGQGGLPYRIAYADRTYSNPATCAYAGWCQSPSSGTHPDPLCWKQEDIQQHGDWPLVRVGTIFTLFGLPYSLMAPQSSVSSKLTAIIIYLASDTNCYVPYALEGGP